MGRRKPSLGYRSRTDAVIALRAEGLSTNAIAERLAISANVVTALASSRARSKGNRTVLLPVEVLDRLKAPACRRSITANELVRQLVETIIDDDMLDAVLDDGVAVAPARAPA